MPWTMASWKLEGLTLLISVMRATVMIFSL
jgi:hypothetical protein